MATEMLVGADLTRMTAELLAAADLTRMAAEKLVAMYTVKLLNAQIVFKIIVNVYWVLINCWGAGWGLVWDCCGCVRTYTQSFIDSVFQQDIF